MGNLLEKQNENENKEEQKESLDNDEIPPDTQIDNAQQENIQNEVSPENENENQTVQQNQPIQEIQGGEEVETQQYQINQDGQQDQVYQYIKDGKIYQVGQDGQLYQVIQEIQDVQEDEDDQMAQLGQQYQINQLEQFYQINQGQNQQIIPPQAYQIINQDQEEQGYQIFQQNHPHQFNLQNQLNIQNQENKLFQQNYQNIKTRNAEYQITRVDNSTFESKKGYNNLEDKISGRGLQFKAKQQRLNKKFKKNIITKTTKRTEPKDSNPKVLLISNIKGEADILNMNMMNYNRNSFKNSIKNNIKNNNKNNNKNSIKNNIKKSMNVSPKESTNKNMNIYKIKNYTSFNKYISNVYKNGKNENINEKKLLKANKNNLSKTSQKKVYKISLLKNRSEYVEIPRKDYDKYSLRDSIVYGDGMDTGEYKFIGPKTLIKEKDVSKGEKADITEEEIKQEINNRRNKTNKKKKISYEIVDKFYAITEMGGKKIKRVDNNKNERILRESNNKNERILRESNNKNDFYSNLGNNYKYSSSFISNNFNPLNINNSYSNNYNINYSSSFIANYNTNNSSYYNNKNNKSYNHKINNDYNNKSNNIYSYNNKNNNIYNSNDNISKSNNAYINKNKNVNNNKNHYYKSNDKNYTEIYEFRQEIPIRGGIKSYNRNSNSQYQLSKNKFFTSNYSTNNNLYNNYLNHNRDRPNSGPLDNYSKYILDQINKIRTDPQSFIGIIEDAKANIIRDRYGRLIYNGKMKIALIDGESAFNESIEVLKNLNPMEPLEYDPYLTVQPPQNAHDIKDKNDLNKKVDDMINNGINIRSYWRDIIKDPIISFLLMIVDDNGIKRGKRRKDILNPTMKFIGISSTEINKNFVCYITLS